MSSFVRSLSFNIILLLCIEGRGADKYPLCQTQTEQQKVYGAKHGEMITVVLTTCR